MPIVIDSSALLSITMGTLYQKKYCAQFDLRTGSVIQFAASAIICLPLMFLFETREIIWAPELILSLIWAVLALSIGAISLLFVMIRNGEATRVTSLMYLTREIHKTRYSCCLTISDHHKQE